MIRSRNPIGDVYTNARNLLSQQVDGASLAAFRICFGLVMLAHAIKYLIPQGGTSLKDYLYHETTFNFTYPGFGWVQSLPEPFWTYLFVLMAIAALGVTLGVFYRTCAVALFATYSYIFLSEMAKYNNHYYLMCLLALLLAMVPADRRFSVSAWLKQRNGKPLSYTVPFWTVALLRTQLFIVYFYGGLAKLDADWLTGIPMIGKGEEVLAYWTPLLNLPAVDPLYVAVFICWVGLIFDLSIGFLLLSRRTRLAAVGLVAVFHISNHFLFPIGLFPAMAFLTTLIFFEPDWPVKVAQWCRSPRMPTLSWRWALLGALTLPPAGLLLAWRDSVSGFLHTPQKKLPHWLAALLLLYVAGQLVFPFRHHMIEGDPNWTEEGQDFSWRMMLRAKDASHTVFHVIDRELVVADGRGGMRVDWSKCSEDCPRTVYVPIDSPMFIWEHHPGLTATFEPNVGLRAIYRLNATDDAVQKTRELKSQWKQLYGRETVFVRDQS